jgi:DNA transposition AAA+ family ATPase
MGTYTNGAHKNNNDSNSALSFIALYKTTQKQEFCKKVGKVLAWVMSSSKYNLMTE